MKTSSFFLISVFGILALFGVFAMGTPHAHASCLARLINGYECPGLAIGTVLDFHLGAARVFSTALITLLAFVLAVFVFRLTHKVFSGISFAKRGVAPQARVAALTFLAPLLRWLAFFEHSPSVS